MSYEKKLIAMRHNKRDWKIQDIMVISDHLNIHYASHGSSHYVFRYDGLEKNLSIPKHIDIHPDYITKFLHFIDEVQMLKNQEVINTTLNKSHKPNVK
jgi:hypothetical protein